jgi:hypothetical protein
MSISKVQQIKTIYNTLQKVTKHITMKSVNIQDELETISLDSLLDSVTEEKLELEFIKLEEIYLSMKEALDKIENILKEDAKGTNRMKQNIHNYFANINQESHW